MIQITAKEIKLIIFSLLLAAAFILLFFVRGHQYNSGDFQREIGGIVSIREKVSNRNMTESLIYFYNGMYNLAAQECIKAIHLTPYKYTAYERLGSALYKLGKVEEANIEWKKALELRAYYGKIIK